VRVHRYVCEGRADDADVADSAADDTHEPAVAIGLQTTRRTKLGSAPTKVPQRHSGVLRVPRTEALRR
jgi:hypothetical protein